MVLRTCTQDEIRIQGEGGHPMHVVFERVQCSSLFRIPYSNRPIAAGGIEHVGPTPFNDVHAACPPRMNSARRVRRGHTQMVPSLGDDARRGDVALLYSTQLAFD